MSSLARAALAAVVLAAVAPVAHAAPVPPDAGNVVTFPFPTKAPVVVQVKGVGTARDRLTTMLKAALPDDIETINKKIDGGLKQMLADRTLTAVPKDGRVFLVINDFASLLENTPAVSLLVPVTSYKEFRATALTADERKTFAAGKSGVDEVKLNAFGEERVVYMVDLKEYVALSPDMATAEAYAIKYAKATTAAMAPDLAKTFTTADVAVYVNLDVINDAYGNQIRAFKGLIDFAIMQAQMGGMIPGINKKQLDAAKTMLEGVFQAVADGRGVVLAAEFRPDGLNLSLQMQFAEGTASTKLIGTESPGPLAEVGKLPAGLAQYTGMKFGPKFVETMRGLSQEFAAPDDDEKANAAVNKKLKEVLAAGPRGEVSGVGTAGLSLTVANYADPKKAAAAVVGCFEALPAGGRYQTVILKSAPKVTPAARKHKGFAFAEVQLALDFDATLKDLPDELQENMRAQLSRLVKEKTTVWIGTDGKAVVQIVAADWAAAAAALDDFLDGKKSLAAAAGFKLTRKNLPPDVSLLMMLETGQSLTALVDSLRSVKDAVPDFPKIGKVKPLTGPATFVGVALTLKGDTATGNLFIPGSAIAAGRKLFDGLFRRVD